MKTTNLRYAASRPAFTLVEIITVIAIIMALAAMTIGGLSFAQKKAEVGRTTVFVASVGQALEQYRADNGFFPYGDGLKDSTEQVYIALSGDGVLKYDQAAQTVVIDSAATDGEPDGEPNIGAQIYLGTLDSPDWGSDKFDKEVVKKRYNIRKSTNGGAVIVDAWRDVNDSAQRQELYYRHNPDENSSSPDPAKMNPPSDFDLWSLGPVDLDKTTEEQKVDYIKNW